MIREYTVPSLACKSLWKVNICVTYIDSLTYKSWEITLNSLNRPCILGRRLCNAKVVDRVSKNLKISEWNAFFSIYFMDKSKSFLLKKFFRLFQNEDGVLHSNIYVVKTRIFCPACQVKQQTSIHFLYINIRFFL